MSDEKVTAIQVRPEVRPSDSGVRTPAPYVNSIRLGYDPYGFTMSFFAIPADALDLTDVREEVERKASTASPDDVVSVRVTLDPVSKVWFPAQLMSELITLLVRTHSQWQRTHQPSPITPSTEKTDG